MPENVEFAGGLIDLSEVSLLELDELDATAFARELRELLVSPSDEDAIARFQACP